MIYVKDDNTAITSILNTAEKQVKITKLDIHVDFIENENIYNNTSIKTISNSSNKSFESNHLDKITNLLRTTHMNKEEKNSIIKIRHEYNDIVYIEDDKLTYTDTITHQIPTIFPIPVNTKTYRYPEVHKAEVNKQIHKLLDLNIISQSTSQ